MMSRIVPSIATPELILVLGQTLRDQSKFLVPKQLFAAQSYRFNLS
jgi:hypothetical protein